MSFLIDTNIVSELARPSPNTGVLSWADNISQVSLSVITVEELQFGLYWRPNSRIITWLNDFQDEYCNILPISVEVAQVAGKWRGDFQKNGIVRTQADMLIAATAAVHGATLVTRNEKDFKGCGIVILNPFN